MSSEHDLEISGMSCASCVRRVETALANVAGVSSASVNLVTKEAHVELRDRRVEPRALVEAVTKAGYGARVKTNERAPDPHDETRRAGRAALIAAVFGVPLLVVGMAHDAFPWASTAAGRWAQLVVATVVVFGPGARFFVAAGKALRHRAADMSTLVALGSGAAWAYSAAATAAPQLFDHFEHGVMPHVYFEAAAAIVTFVLLGRYLEARSRERLTQAVGSLAALQPKQARRVRGEGEDEVPVETLAVGDLVRVRPGERIAADGEVVEGRSEVDEALLTGESMPVSKIAGSSVLAGSINRGAPLTFRVVRVARDSTAARIAAAVADAQRSRAPIARFADVVAGYFVPAVVGIAFVTLAVWLVIDPSVALERFVAVLIIACPCALGLATPAAVAVATGRGAELGVLIKGGEPLETLSRIDTVLLDKTGTLTAGHPEVTEMITAASAATPEPRVAAANAATSVLRLAAALEQDSEHPIARAVVGAAKARGITPPRARDIAVEHGSGVAGDVEGRAVRLGSASWLGAAGIDIGGLAAQADRLAAEGKTPIFVAVDGELAALFAVADTVRASSKTAVHALQRLGLDVVMVSGDRELVARAVATDLGIARVVAGVRPEEKARIVGDERGGGKRVAMVGDGINDAPALAAADIGIAVGSGTDVANAAADVTLTRDGIAGLPLAVALARASMRTIRQNLFWAFAYNVVGIPIAAGALYGWTGWLLSPVLASAAMSLSSVSVVLNSLRLRRFRGGAW